MNYEDVRKNIEMFLSDKSLCNGFVNTHWMKKIVDLYEKMVFDILEMEKDTKIPYKNETLHEAIEISQLFIELITSDDLSKRKNDFIKNYCLLIQNWNVLQSKELLFKLDYINRFFEEKLTLLETLSLFQKTYKRIAIVQEWLPPSIEISKHYLNVLMEKE